MDQLPPLKYSLQAKDNFSSGFVLIYLDKCNRLNVMNRTSSMHKSVLHCVLDKGLYFSLELCLYPILFPK